MGTDRKVEEERRNRDHFFKPPAVVDAVGPTLAPCRQSSNDDKRQRRRVGYSPNREHVKNTMIFKDFFFFPRSFCSQFSIFYLFSVFNYVNVFWKKKEEEKNHSRIARSIEKFSLKSDDSAIEYADRDHASRLPWSNVDTRHSSRIVDFTVLQCIA